METIIFEGTAFVSGHLSVTSEEFEGHYIPALEAALEKGCSFVVGDAKGADAMAQDWLKAHKAEANVYHMFKSPRHNAGFPYIGGFKTDDERDTAMTAASDFDIAWVRPGREKSGTARNLARRVVSP